MSSECKDSNALASANWGNMNMSYYILIHQQSASVRCCKMKSCDTCIRLHHFRAREIRDHTEKKNVAIDKKGHD